MSTYIMFLEETRVIYAYFMHVIEVGVPVEGMEECEDILV